jgi:hypothetical protein
MLTKGKMIKCLKEKAGIRKADKEGYTVSLEHLKTYQVSKLYYENCK